MADDLDMTQERLEREQALRDRARAESPYTIDPGVKGDCDLCGEWSGRLIGGACAPCRDKHGLA